MVVITLEPARQERQNPEPVSETVLAETVPARHRARGMRRASPLELSLAGALGFGAAFLLSYFVFVRTTGGQAAENGVVRSAQSGLSSTSDWATPLRDGDKIAVLCAAAVLLMVIALLRRRFALAAAGSTVLGGSLLVAHVLKMYVFDRPPLTGGGSVATHNSFPSGHVTAAMAIVLAITLVVPRRARPYVLVPGALGVAWVASATITLGWHRLSDTVGGGFLVATICCLVAAALHASNRDRGARTGRVPVVAALIAPSVLVGALYAVSRTATSDNAQLVGAVILAAASCLLVVSLTYWVLPKTD
jgi:membrane-associated phospholipid phosphatase